jgi:YD repeat-containing protein
VNKPTRVLDAKGGETLIEYDALGNVTDVWEPGASYSAHMTYNAMGLVNTVTNQEDEETLFDYYATGQIANIITPLGNITSLP